MDSSKPCRWDWPVRAIHFPLPGRAEVVERPRPHVIEPDDAVVMVTTAGLTVWDIALCEDPARDISSPVPGGEFAGNVVETGPGVGKLQINDVVFALTGWREQDGRVSVFGRDGLDGGHADYVRVPHADRVLIKTTAAAEERSLLSGGTLALGAWAAGTAKRRRQGGRLVLAGCDPLGVAALAVLHGAGAFAEVVALDRRPARLALARRYGARTVNVRAPDGLQGVQRADAVICGALAEGPGAEWVAGAVAPGGIIVFTEPDGVEKWTALDVLAPPDVELIASDWPAQDFASRLAAMVHTRELDLGPVVSHVVPIDMAGEAYKQAISGGPAVQKVLLKP